MKFKTGFTVRENRLKCPTGHKTEMRHSPTILKDGRRILKRDREVDIYNLIQSHREECEIENIIRRAVEGDYNALNAINGTYADITNCPSSIAEAQQYIINAKEEFEKLPKDIKAKFEFNPEMYVAEMGGNTEGWLEKMGIKAEIENNKSEAEKRAKLDKNFAKAMETIANGTIINNAGGELKNE